METQFDRPSVIRQPNAQRIPKPSVLGKLAPFSNSPGIRSFSKKESVIKTHVLDGLSKQVTAQILPQTASKAVRNTYVIQPGMYQVATNSTQNRVPHLPQTSRNTNTHVSTSTRVTHRTSVSKPQLKSTHVKDKVMQNNSQVKFKKTGVEEHHRIYSISKKTKSIVQLVLFIVYSGCTKYMMDNLKLLCNFVEKFLGTVHFGNDQFALILGYEDLFQSNVKIKWVYYVEDLDHNLFSGNDLLTGNRGSDLYTISLQEITSAIPLCLMAKASPTQSWLWHQRLSHLNFNYINLLSKKDIMIGLPKLKYVKDQLCSSCEVSKAKRSSFKTKAILSSKGWLNLLHMDLCGPMRVARINGKKYILFLQNILDLYFKHFKLSEDVVNRILQVVLDLQHFKSSLFIFAATILQSSSAIHHISNIDNYVHQIIKFQSILITSSHSLWSSQSFGHQKAINGFDIPLPVAVCSGLVNPLAPRKVFWESLSELFTKSFSYSFSGFKFIGAKDYLFNTAYQIPSCLLQNSISSAEITSIVLIDSSSNSS
ncbi:retrovirus-related pol polyprotein from transposon TNT 1-94 [Tanacetum coccineum]